MLSVCSTVTGDTTLVAAPSPADKYYRVYGYQVTTASNAGIVYLKSGATIKAIIGSTVVAGGGLTCPPTTFGYFECAKGDPLNVSQTTTGVAVSVNVQFEKLG